VIAHLGLSILCARHRYVPAKSEDPAPARSRGPRGNI